MRDRRSPKRKVRTTSQLHWVNPSNLRAVSRTNENFQNVEILEQYYKLRRKIERNYLKIWTVTYWPNKIVPAVTETKEHAEYRTDRFLFIQTIHPLFTSKDRSCFTAQIQTAIETTEMNINGMNTRIHKCLPDCNLSQANNSNISRIKCRANVISIAL